MNALLRLAHLGTALATAHGATLFEGFYRIERDHKHIGFAVQRLRQEGDQRTLTSYYRFKRPDESEVFESFKVTTRANGQPVATEHHGDSNGLVPAWASFSGAKARVNFGAPKTPRPTMVDGVKMLSSMLFFMGDVPKLDTKHVYKYRAFAEDRGRLETGTLHFVGVTDVRGARVYRFIDDFGGEPIENFISASGQPLGSRALGGDYICYWVPGRDQAIDVFKYPNQDVIKLFGDLPDGRKSEWASAQGLVADRVIRDAPKWAGRRVITPQALARTTALPLRNF